MERFAKRKIKVLPARGGGKHIFFCEDSGTKYHVAQVTDYASKEDIYETARYWYSKLNLSSTYGKTAGGED